MRFWPTGNVHMHLVRQRRRWPAAQSLAKGSPAQPPVAPSHFFHATACDCAASANSCMPLAAALQPQILDMLLASRALHSSTPWLLTSHEAWWLQPHLQPQRVDRQRRVNCVWPPLDRHAPLFVRQMHCKCCKDAVRALQCSGAGGGEYRQRAVRLAKVLRLVGHSPVSMTACHLRPAPIPASAPATKLTG